MRSRPQRRDPTSPGRSLSGSCAASPPGLCLSFLAFPRLPSLAGSSVLCPGNRLPHSNTQQGNSLPRSSLRSSHTRSQKREENLAGQPELNPFPCHILGPQGTASQTFTRTPNFHHKADSRFTSSPWASSGKTAQGAVRISPGAFCCSFWFSQRGSLHAEAVWVTFSLLAITTRKNSTLC